MLLRSTLEKYLPTKDDEGIGLSRGARKYVFRGSYALPSRIVRVQTLANNRIDTKDNFPFKHVITKETASGRRKEIGRWGDSISYKTPDYEAVEELNKPEALARATRIERIARRIKATTGIVLASAAIFAGVEGVFSDSAGAPAGHGKNAIENCADVVNAEQALIPVESGRLGVGVAQRLGESVCRIGDIDYVMTPTPSER